MKSSTRSIHFSLLLSLLFVLVSVCVAFASGGGEGGMILPASGKVLPLKR